MTLFDLHLQFNHKPHTFRLKSNMPFNHIKYTVGNSFNLSPDAFVIEVHDPRFKDKYVLDDERLVELHQQLPRTFTSSISGDILLYSSSSGKELKCVQSNTFIAE